MKNKPSFKKSLIGGFAVVLAIFVLAYGFQVTKVNFEETQSENRLRQLTRIIRALAHPKILEYDQEEIFVESPIYLPCPEGEVPSAEPDTSGPYIILDPSCNDAEEFINVYGYGFEPGVKGPINFIPPSGVSLTLANFEADSEGYFEERVQLPRRQPLEEAQIIRAVSRRNIGFPRISNVGKLTWEKIIETVFLALLATVFGTLIAVPLSFLAARNLMSDVKSPVASVALNLIGWMLGIAIGLQAVRLLEPIRDLLLSNTLLSIIGLITLPLIAWLLTKWALPPEEMQIPSLGIRIMRIIALIVTALSILLASFLLASLLYELGQFLESILELFDFLGYFTSQIGESIRMVTPLAAALIGAGVVGSAFTHFGLIVTEKLTISTLKIINIALSAIAGAMLFAIIGLGIQWLYQTTNPLRTILIPAVIGAILGGAISLRYGPKDLVPIGSTIYLVMRTLLNAVRSIEPLIYVIIFVVWVGIGPFAGALALTLHTIAALAKLYSEQVESISPGPLEAVTATGANRIQTIIYAVVPQIIPPYISFTMYRWDINVRMSTIIGFAGGGGIGFLLQQNINLLDYHAAAVQMLAIAVVVATMDYTSALIRERFV